jgi:hypothetical protein
LEQHILVSRIYQTVINIYSGRNGFAIIGKERAGRILYEDGISEATVIFQEVQSLKNPQFILLAEYAFLTQEFQLCDTSDTDTINSLSKAIESFDDAFLALKALDELDCKSVDSFFPHNKKYRVKGFPKDAFHLAYISHKTRLQNILRTPGLDSIEKTLLKIRLEVIPAAQNSYLEKQKKALS